MRNPSVFALDDCNPFRFKTVLECRLYADGTLLAVLSDVHSWSCEPLLSTNRRHIHGEGAALIDAPADNICHVSKEDDKIPRCLARCGEYVPNREYVAVRLVLHGG